MLQKYICVFTVLTTITLSIMETYSTSISPRATERIAGFVLYRNVDGTIEYLLLKKDGEDDWSPPKGHVEDKESDVNAAIREAFEETGLIYPEDFAAFIQYNIYFEYETNDGDLKQVNLWPSKLLNLEKEIILSDENEDYKWLEFSEAKEIIKKQYGNALEQVDNIVRAIEVKNY